MQGWSATENGERLENDVIQAAVDNYESHNIDYAYKSNTIADNHYQERSTTWKKRKHIVLTKVHSTSINTLNNDRKTDVLFFKGTIEVAVAVINQDVSGTAWQKIDSEINFLLNKKANIKIILVGGETLERDIDGIIEDVITVHSFYDKSGNYTDAVKDILVMTLAEFKEWHLNFIIR